MVVPVSGFEHTWSVRIVEEPRLWKLCGYRAGLCRLQLLGYEHITPCPRLARVRTPKHKEDAPPLSSRIRCVMIPTQLSAELAGIITQGACPLLLDGNDLDAESERDDPWVGARSPLEETPEMRPVTTSNTSWNWRNNSVFSQNSMEADERSESRTLSWCISIRTAGSRHCH